MDEDIVKQIFDELLSSLEPLETKTAALLSLLKAKGIANDEELAPFLEQAGNASNVRWRAMRVRTAALISSAMTPPGQQAEAGAAKPSDDSSQSEENKENPDRSGAESTEDKGEPSENKSPAATDAHSESASGRQESAEKPTESRQSTHQEADNKNQAPPNQDPPKQEANKDAA